MKKAKARSLFDKLYDYVAAVQQEGGFIVVILKDPKKGLK